LLQAAVLSCVQVRQLICFPPPERLKPLPQSGRPRERRTVDNSPTFYTGHPVL